MLYNTNLNECIYIQDVFFPQDIQCRIWALQLWLNNKQQQTTRPSLWISMMHFHPFSVSFSHSRSLSFSLSLSHFCSSHPLACLSLYLIHHNHRKISPLFPQFLPCGWSLSNTIHSLSEANTTAGGGWGGDGGCLALSLLLSLWSGNAIWSLLALLQSLRCPIVPFTADATLQLRLNSRLLRAKREHLENSSSVRGHHNSSEMNDFAWISWPVLALGLWVWVKIYRMVDLQEQGWAALL